MSATVTPAASDFALQCQAYDLTGNASKLRAAALEALNGEGAGLPGWSLRTVRSDDVVIDHWSGFVRVSVDDGEFSVEEFDRFTFEVGKTIFRGDRRVQGPRAIRFAQALAAELEVKA